MAVIPAAPSTLAGKNLRLEAPALAASSASVGVKTPGIVTMPHARALAMISGSTLGVTRSRPPTSWSRSTASRVRTVPAPTRIPAGAFLTAISMARNGSGELSGISIAVMPLSISALTIPSASSGLTPRRMATSGRIIGGNGTTLIRLILYKFQMDSAAIERPRRTASSAPIDLTGMETVSNAN